MTFDLKCGSFEGQKCDKTTYIFLVERDRHMVTTGMKHLWEVDIRLSESAHNRVPGSGTGLPESGIGYPAALFCEITIKMSKVNSRPHILSFGPIGLLTSLLF